MSARPGRPAGRADRRRPPTRPRPGPIVERLAAELLSNPLIEAYEIEILGARRRSTPRGRRRAGAMTVRIGVVVFPGSNRDIDAVNALEVAGAEPVDPVARRRVDLDGVAGDPPAGRLRLRRLPPGRRDRPVQPGHAGRRGVRRGRRPRPRDLQRLPGPDRGAACCPARCSATGASASSRARSRSSPSGSTRRSRTPSASAGRCACRSPTARAAFYADDATLDELEADGQVLFRYVHADGTPAGRRGGPGEPERLAPGDRRRDERRAATWPA